MCLWLGAPAGAERVLPASHGGGFPSPSGVASGADEEVPPARGPTTGMSPLKGARNCTSTTRCPEAGVYFQAFTDTVASVLLTTLQVQGSQGRGQSQQPQRAADTREGLLRAGGDEGYDSEDLNEEEAAVAEEAGVRVYRAPRSEDGGREEELPPELCYESDGSVGDPAGSAPTVIRGLRGRRRLATALVSGLSTRLG